MAKEDKTPERKAEKMIEDLCYRIERMCRYSPLDDKEVDGQSMKDRTVVSKLYGFHRKKGESEDSAARKARMSAIRLVLNEVFE